MAVLAEYFCGRDEVYLFLAGTDSADPRVTTFSLPPLLAELTAYFHQLLGNNSGEAGPAVKAIMEPIVQQAREDELICVVAHGILHYLPFHAIPTSQGTLGFRNPLCYSPSASVLPICRRGPRLRGRTIVTVGDPSGDLPYARREAAWVAAAFQSAPLIGVQATKQALFSALDAHDPLDIVHFACHGRAGAKDAFESGVLLAPLASDGPADLFSAREILRRHLRAALVTVSACDAGLGTVESSDEVLGLTRALLNAGVSSVLLSSWPLDDLSTYLMVMRFYQELEPMIDAGHGNKALAVRSAQRYIHDLTIRDVIAQCDGAGADCHRRGDLSGQFDFAEEASNWAATAGDFEDAIQRSRKLSASLQQTPAKFAERRERVRNRIEELEFRSMLRRPALAYEARPFANELHWAGLFLHGDWAL